MKKTTITAALVTLLICGCQYRPTEDMPTTAKADDTTPQTIAVAATTAAPTETEAPTDPIAALLDSMSVEEKVGQLFLARCPDTDAIVDIGKYHLGGYILFGRDFEYESPESLRIKLESYQAVSQIPMLIAVDEEGGDVTRVSCFDAFRETRFPSVRRLFDQGGMELLLSTEQEKCALLSSLGINVNMAPVCDITTDPGAFMYARSLGQDAQTTAQFVAEMTDIMAQNRIGSVLKHFPGYGNNSDTHNGIVADTRSLEDLASNDLIPFAAGIRSGCGAIMMSHIIITCMDENNPASLSPAVHKYLREDMDFDGVIVTDDLVMEAITGLYGVGEAAVLAVLAGNDLLCSSNYPEQYTAVLDAVNSGRISTSLLDSAVYRVLRWKFSLGIISN